MNRTDYKTILYVTITCALAPLWGGPVRAQSAVPAEQATALEEIIVTAREREENVLNVPVIETVIPRTELERFQMIEMSDLPTIVPGLVMAHTLASTVSKSLYAVLGRLRRIRALIRRYRSTSMASISAVPPP